MFGQLLKVRLKAAENALRDGRLDEAYRLAISPDLRAHRRGAAVLATLTERFYDRAREHYRADRFVEAMMDLDRSQAGGGMAERIAELRAQVQTVAAEVERNKQSRQARIDAARQRVERASLAAGQQILDGASEHDRHAEGLRREIAERADDAATVVEQAEQLIAQGRLAAAADRVRRAKSIDAHAQAVTRIETELCGKVIDNARSAMVQGRLARASDELACLGSLGRKLPAKRELTDMLTAVRKAAEAVEANHYAEARRQALKLTRLLPNAKWAKAVVGQLKQIEDIRTSLCAGPLAERMSGSTGGDKEPTTASLKDTVALPDRAAATAGSLPDRLLLLVDGGGSYLIVRGGRASVGRVACDDPADVPILSDLAERHANITRVDDDYFLFSTKDVEVAGRKTKHQLLRDGDRVVLGRKAKFTFRLPSRRSASAVLNLSDTTKMPHDVRRVVLFDQHATLGQSAGAHVYCRHAGTPLVLFERGGALWIRHKSDGHVDAEAKQLRLGQPMEIGGVSLVLEPWHLRSPGGATA